MPIVVIERGNDKGRSIKIDAGKQYFFGRDPNVAVALSDTLISRRHFSIISDGSDFRIQDLGSTNGTFLNDEKITESPIHVGDKIQAGDTILSFLSDQREETAQGLVGKTIGGYKILERVGRGGMGTVYKANQLSLNRIVAFKVLSARLLKDEKFIERFKSEARAAGQLNHPNIVGVYDVGTDRDIHFFSMEFMDGGSVQDIVGKDAKLPWQEALDVLIQATRALIFAEKKGIVHRDVKPDNLMLTSDGQTKLADLGLAKKIDEATNAVEEGIFGTPHFISPEQAQGREVDHRADLYSLGATAYRMLAGRTPFKGANVTEIIQQQINSDPPPLEQFCPDAPHELLSIVMKLMRKNPDDRYATADELLAALEQVRLRFHLKVHGGAGSKGIIVALVLALAAVAGVVVFALTRKGPSDDANHAPPPVVKTTTVQPKNVPVTPTGPTPEEIQQKKETDAHVAFLNIQVKDTHMGDLAKTALSSKKDWEKIADEWQKMAKAYDKTSWAGLARKRAKAIHDAIANQEAAKQKREAKAQSTWKSLMTKVNDLLSDQRFAAALTWAEAEGKKRSVQEAVASVAGAKAIYERWIAATPKSIRGRFETAWKQAQAAAEKRSKDGDFIGAWTDLSTFFRKANTVPGSSEAAKKTDPFKAAKHLEEIRKKLKSGFSDVLLKKLAADRSLYWQLWQTVRHYEKSATSTSFNPVFNYRFGIAADRFESHLTAKPGPQVFQTELYKKRIRTLVARLRRADRLMDSLVSHFAQRHVKSMTLNLPGAVFRAQNIASVRIDFTRHPFATREGLAVVERFRVAGGFATSKEILPWEKASAKVIWDGFFQDGHRFQMTPAEHADACFFLAFICLRAPIAEQIAAAGKALDGEDRAWLQHEVDAMVAFAANEKLPRSSDPTKRTILLHKFVKQYCDTDYFTFAYGFSEPWERLFPKEIIDTWLELNLKPFEKK